jgi:hypothetical protein
LQNTFSCLDEARVPVIAAIQGGCIGDAVVGERLTLSSGFIGITIVLRRGTVLTMNDGHEVLKDAASTNATPSGSARALR